MKFKSKKDILFGSIILVINAFIIGTTLLGIAKSGMDEEAFWALLPVLAVVGLLFWLYYGTTYELSEEHGLIYRTGPIKGRISTDRIREIVKGKTLWVGFRPATARKGLIIKYDKYNEIYISPDSNDAFIEKILELNGTIEIKE